MKWIIVPIAAMLGAGLQTLTGFGCAVILMMILPHFFGLVSCSVLCNAVCLGLTVILAWQFRKHIQWELVLLPTISYVLFNTVAILFVKKIDLRVLTAIFGIFLILLSAYSLYSFRSGGVSIRPSKRNGFLFGAFSGISAGLFTIGGPMVAMYLLPASRDRDCYVGNIQFLFAVSNVTTLITRLASGITVEHFLPLAILGIGGALAGKWAGLRVSDRLNADTLKKVIYAFVGVSGAITLIQQL